MLNYIAVLLQTTSIGYNIIDEGNSIPPNKVVVELKQSVKAYTNGQLEVNDLWYFLFVATFHYFLTCIKFNHLT